MKNFTLKPDAILYEQNTETEQNIFSSKDLLTREELSKIKGGDGDEEINKGIVGGPK